MPDERASRRIMREQAEQAVRDTTVHGTYSVEVLTFDGYYQRIGRSLPGMERVLMSWDPENPSLTYYLDVRQVRPSHLLRGSEAGIVWITLSKSGEIIRMPST